MSGTKFKKKYINTHSDLKKIPIDQRNHYYIKRELLDEKKGFSKQEEECLSRQKIETAGILCKPFWEDSRLNIEGECFIEYISDNPDFGLLVRKTVLEKMLKAQSHLQRGIRIVLKAGLRPTEVQVKLFERKLAKIIAENPEWGFEEAYEHTLEYVTDPQKNLPPHSSGGAVDIALWDEDSDEYLDTGSPINFSDDRSWADNFDGLGSAQVKNRKLIKDVMLKEGFANLASEWWHYSYGDQRWAVFYDKPEALYASVEIKYAD